MIDFDLTDFIQHVDLWKGMFNNTKYICVPDKAECENAKDMTTEIIGGRKEIKNFTDLK